MRQRNRAYAVALSLAVTLATAQAAAAAHPAETRAGGGDPPSDDRTLPLTSEQAASRHLKERLISALSNRTATTPGAMSAAGCPVPNATTPVTATNSNDFAAAEAAATCPTPSEFGLAVKPRQQEKWYYCGPAVVQIVSNYGWRMAAGSNKYSQTAISNNWTRTDVNGQTYLGDMITGMNRASRLPSGFAYMQKHRPSFGDWHATIVSGTYNWRMPLAAGVNPHAPGAYYYIVSWPVEKVAAHYIELHGYKGFSGSPNGSRLVKYSDTAGSYAAPGVRAGNFVDVSYDVYQTMLANSGNMIY